MILFTRIETMHIKWLVRPFNEFSLVWNIDIKTVETLVVNHKNCLVDIVHAIL